MGESHAASFDNDERTCQLRAPGGPDAEAVHCSKLGNDLTIVQQPWLHSATVASTECRSTDADAAASDRDEQTDCTAEQLE